METQRQWSDPAVARTTPALLGLYSLRCSYRYEASRRPGESRTDRDANASAPAYGPPPI